MENSHKQKVKIFFDKTDNYLGKSFGVRLRQEIVRKELGDLHGMRLLDIGCGDGSISMQYAQNDNELTLIDISEQMLALAEAKIPPNYADKVSILNTDFHDHHPDKGYDVILCLGILAHVDSLAHTTAKLSELLRPGGICILQYTDQEKWVSRVNWWVANVLLQARNGYDYKIKSIFHRKLLVLLQAHDLTPKKTIRFSLLFPGMGKLPDSLLYQYQLFGLKNQWIGRFGSDVILLLRKRNR